MNAVQSNSQLQLQSQSQPLSLYGNPQRMGQSDETPWQRFVAFFKAQYGPQAINKFEKVARSGGATIFPPALIFMMNQPVPQNDVRFDLNFLIPAENRCHFLQNRPIGKLSFGGGFWRINDASQIAKNVLGEDLVGNYFFKYLGSMIEAWYSYIEYVTKLAREGVAWKRQVLKKADGSLGLFLVRGDRKSVV